MKNGESHLNFEKSLLDFTVKDIKYNVEDYNSKVLGKNLSFSRIKKTIISLSIPGQAMTQVLNENPTLFLDAIKPVLKKVFFDVYESAFKKIFMAVPENQIFL